LDAIGVTETNTLSAVKATAESSGSIGGSDWEGCVCGIEESTLRDSEESN
jgi:hypothetical protein